MVKLKSLKPHTFNSKVVEKDEEFEADEAYANTLVSLGRAVRVDESGEAQSTKTEPTSTGSTDKSGTYQTRDMKAGGDTTTKEADKVAAAAATPAPTSTAKPAGTAPSKK